MTKVALVMVTPVMAQFWLDMTNTDNRRLREWWVNAMAAAMRRGEWITTHQGIAFTENGLLLDGQHRLMAIIRSGIAQTMVVTTDLPAAAFGVIDCGIKRTLSDLTDLPVRTAEVGRFFAAMLYGGVINSAQCTRVAQAGVAEAHDRLMEQCGTATAYYSSSPVRSAAVTLLLDGVNPNYVLKTYTNLVLQHFGDLPTVAHSLIRQVNAKHTRAADSRDAYARALKVLHPAYANLTKLQVSDHDVDVAADYGRTVLRHVLSATKERQASKPELKENHV